MILVLDQSEGTISRYHADGSAANFAALGGNVIDGKGDGGCPTLPSDCDQTPENGLPGFGGNPKEMQIAIDQSGTATDGDIYVTQARDHLIDIFSAGGRYLGQLTGYEEGPAAEGAAHAFGQACGVSVDSSGAVYVGDFSGQVHKFVPSADPPANTDNTANFPLPSACTLAAGVGSTAGSIFADRFNGELFKLDASSGALAYKLGNGHTTVSVDPSSGHVYAPAGEEVREYDASGYLCDASGAHDPLLQQSPGSRGRRRQRQDLREPRRLPSDLRLRPRRRDGADDRRSLLPRHRLDRRRHGQRSDAEGPGQPQRPGDRIPDRIRPQRSLRRALPAALGGLRRSGQDGHLLARRP